MKTVTSLLIALAAGTLASCTCCGGGTCESPTTTTTTSQPAEQDSKPAITNLVGTYHGVIPAADRSGFDVTIQIREDGSAHFTQKVVDDNEVLEDFEGQVSLSLNSPQVTIRGEESTYHFNIVEKDLLMVSPDGAEPEVRDAYMLRLQQ